MDLPKKNIWKIAIKKRGEDLFDLSNYRIIEPPQGFYMADPFLFHRYVFYELYDRKKGVIACSEIEGLDLKNEKVVLEKDYHLSFPAIFQKDDELYMTPEGGRRVDLYRMTQFPQGWEKVKTLREGHDCADPIMYKGKVFAGDNPRSAGNIFEYKGKTIRPVQDNNPKYGSGIIFTELQTGKEIHRIRCEDLGACGLHTFNFNKEYVVIDLRYEA